MQLLKQSTQVIVRVGPFVDIGDGFTPQVDIGNPDTNLVGTDEAELLKNASVEVDISGRTWVAITGCRGWYDLTLTTDDTGTLGLLSVVVQDDSDCLPVFRDFMVVPANVWDSLFGADNLQVDVVQLAGVAQSLTDLKDFADAGYDPAESKVTGCKVNDDMVGEPTAALSDINLDHFMKEPVVSRANMTAEIVDDTVLANILTKTDGDTSDFDPTSHSLEAIQILVDAIVDAGSGSVSVDENYDVDGGGDPNQLAYMTAGEVGIDNATVIAYLKTDYDNGDVSSGYVKALVTTDVNGKWTKNMNLDPGTYTFYYFRQPDYGPDTQEATITE